MNEDELLLETLGEEEEEVPSEQTQPEEDTLEDMMTAPMSAGARNTVEVEEDEDLSYDEDDILSMVFNNKTKSDKYKADLIQKAETDPASVMIETPLGWMTVLEAAQMGFNPETGEFSNEEGITEQAELDTSMIDPEMAAKLQADMDPQNQGFDDQYVEGHGGGPGMMDMMGLGQGGPMPEEPMADDLMMPPPEDDPEGGMF